jgi:two-component system OmpR family sensor kinase
VPEIPSSELQDLVNRIVTTPSVDGSLSYRMLVQQNSQGDTFVTASPLDGVDSAIDRLVRILVVSGFVALLAAIAACWWIIQRDLRPVDRMVDTAAAIAAGDLSRRVPDADPRTELGRLGGALNEMLGQIESSLEVRTASETRLRRFVADAAHELRTPLTSLRGYAELYRQGALPDETSVSNAMGRIEAEGARMSRLVDDLLLLARMDQQRGIESKTIDVVPVVEEAASDFRAVDPDRPLTVASSGPAIVRGDRIRLRQIIDNLLVNARLHTPPATPVHITVGQHGNEIEIAVRDEGPGISAEDQTRIFERFWRADPARARKTGGSGLGLAIVSSLTEAHGGRITIESEPGAGATFTIHLPAAPIE